MTAFAASAAAGTCTTSWSAPQLAAARTCGLSRSRARVPPLRAVPDVLPRRRPALQPEADRPGVRLRPLGAAAHREVKICVGAQSPASLPGRRDLCSSAAGVQIQTLPKAYDGGVLSPEQLECFHSQGWLPIPGFASPADCKAMMARANELVDSFDPSSVRSIFTTKEQTRRSDDYFLESGDKIRFFFEEAAFDAEGNLVQKKSESINKIGHALHELDPVFRRWSSSPKVEDLLAAVGFKHPLPVQSMYIFKNPRIGGEVVPHQDSTFLATEPLSCVGLWLALEDATQENGCLWALPRRTDVVPLKRRFKRNAGEGPATLFEPGEVGYEDWPQGEMLPLEVPAGTLVLLHGTMVHMSHENRSEKSRHAYALHFVEGDGCHWRPDNWLQRPTPFPDLPALRAKP